MTILESDPFSAHLLTWYKHHARPLPWRGQLDPYAIWISEVMLQQTRVETVIPYFEEWMKRFPNIATIARASLQEVLSLWEGMGYYGRARNLHKAAGLVIENYNGELPKEMTQLLKLPGVGRYTAAAIASIAFGHDEPILDGNVRRVLARHFNISEDARSTSGEYKLREIASQHLPAGKAGDYNQALMDLGAIICRPKAPDCPGVLWRIHARRRL